MKNWIILSCCLLWALPVMALDLEQDVLWQGDLTFSESVRVPDGVTLTIAADAQIQFERGGLEVLGTLVTEGGQMSGTDWDGLILKNSDAKTRLENLKISGAGTGLLVVGGNPELVNLLLQENKVGIELRGKAAGVIHDSRFVGNRKVGLFVKDESTTRIKDCLFHDNGRFGAYIYRAQPEQFVGNRFVANATGLMVAYHGTNPTIAGNRFEDNEIGIQVDRAAQPSLRNNLLVANRTGIHLYRRSDPQISGNRLRDNDVGILVAYSSYPQIDGNDFDGNALAIKLEFQSSAWEKEKGAAARQDEVSARSAFAGQGMRTVTEDQRRAQKLDGVVSAPSNWWGKEGTLELRSLGTDGNLSFLHDGRDQATFEEDGRKYPLDRIDVRLWRSGPVTELSQ